MKLDMKKTVSICWLLTAFCGLLAAWRPASAQARSTVSGRVTDARGVPLADATVTLVNSAALVGYILPTDKDGRYRFTNVPAAPGYVVIFAHEGFSSLRLSHVIVSGARHTEDAALTAGEEVLVDDIAGPQGQRTRVSPASASLPWRAASSQAASSPPASWPTSWESALPAWLQRPSSLLLSSLWTCCGW